MIVIKGIVKRHIDKQIFISVPKFILSQKKKQIKSPGPAPLAQQPSKSSQSSQTKSQQSAPKPPTPLTQKNIDLQLSNLYKKILEEERIRMQKNQERIEQMLEKQRQRSDKKQQQLHQQIRQFMKSMQTLLGVGGLMGLIYYIFTVVNAGGDAFEKVKKYWDQGYTKYQLVQKYSQNLQKLPPYYLEGNLIQKQLSKIEFDGIIGMTYLVGIPGSGKTTALKKVINNLRQKIEKGISRWSKVYYINLRVDDENGKILLQKTKQRIDEMSKLLKSIFSSQKNFKNSLIIIDDIQMLERVLSQQQTKQILESLFLKCEMQSCKLVIVSSSSLSYYRALQSIGSKKSAYMSEVQNMSQENLKQAIKKRVDYEKSVNAIDIPENIVKFLEQYDSIKSVMAGINLVTNQYRVGKWLGDNSISQQKLLEKIKQNDSNKIWDMKISITKLLRQKSSIIPNKVLSQIVKCILKLPKQVKIIHKFTVINEVIKKFPQFKNYLDQISNVIDELDRKNILIFGHPRTKMERKALQEVLEGLK